MKRVSIPLRGDVVKRLNAAIEFDEEYEFPSPYGEMWLKAQRGTPTSHRPVEFPSPYGEMWLKVLDAKGNKANILFPSPYGEMWLKG